MANKISLGPELAASLNTKVAHFFMKFTATGAKKFLWENNLLVTIKKSTLPVMIIMFRIFNQDNPSVQCTVINGVLYIEILTREETGVPGENPRSQVEIA